MALKKEFEMTPNMNPGRHSSLRRSLLALAASAALVPASSWALEFASAPPGNQMPYVAPNVIISVDDSGSMGWRVTSSSSDVDFKHTNPNSDGSWHQKTPRVNVLKYALKQVFNDHTLLSKDKIRLGWQIMWNNAESPGAANVNSENINSMRYLDDLDSNNKTHRQNFLDFIKDIDPGSTTPSHIMYRQADEYMRAGLKELGIRSPWAYKPGKQMEPYLACRRNYHIMMTDGRWNRVNGKSTTNLGSGADTNLGNHDGQSRMLPDGTRYDITSEQTRIYRDKAGIDGEDGRSTVSDWAFKSWADNLQPSIWDPTDPAKRLRASKAYRLAPPIEIIGGKEIERYWNPKFNPATWPHMVTYTIGFSQEAITWPTTISKHTISIQAPTEKVPFGHDGSYPDLINGTKTWPPMYEGTSNTNNWRALDLWHSAINGRGRFYAVSEAMDLEQAFRDILAQINEENAAEAPRAAAATSGSNASRSAVGRYITTYNPDEQWSGAIIAEMINPDGSVEPAWNGQSTADFLDGDTTVDPAKRNILSWNDGADPSRAAGGVDFEWGQLSSSQQEYLGTKNPTPLSENGEKVVEFLRGDHSLEGYEKGDDGFYPASSPFRERKSRQGDIVNSNIWYTPPPASNYAIGGYGDFASKKKADGGARDRTPMLYVGANDGMLHGFSATDGSEKFAYIPKGVIPTLRSLAEPGYIHRYYVDGSPMVGDIATTPNPTNADHWASMLVGTLGAGGKGYFVLNVTDPENVGPNSVKLDNTLSESQPSINACSGPAVKQVECDLGHIFSVPVQDATNPMRANQISRLNNDRWAAIMGNGYNSRNQRPALLIQYLDGDKELVIIPVTDPDYAQDNGLSTPRIVDINGDDRADIVYAGDLMGNLWKFDLTHPDTVPNPGDPYDSGNWKVAFSDGNSFTPLYTATGPNGGVQPITAPPTVKPNNRGVRGMMVAFGTGRDITTDDPNNTDTQTLYGILDDTLYTLRDVTDPRKGLKIGDGTCSLIPCPTPTPAGSGRDNLVEQRVADEVAGDKDNASYTFWALDDPKDQGSTMTELDWSSHRGWFMDLPINGERLLKNIEFYASTNVLSVYSQVPAKGVEAGTENELPESCDPVGTSSERQFLTLLNIMDGRRPSVQIMDANGDQVYNDADMFVSRVEVKAGAQTQTIITDRDSSSFIKADDDLLLRLAPELSLRPGWRQLR